MDVLGTQLENLVAKDKAMTVVGQDVAGTAQELFPNLGIHAQGASLALQFGFEGTQKVEIWAPQQQKENPASTLSDGIWFIGDES